MYLGIDFGERKIGVAISEGYFAKPYLVISANSLDAQIAKIKNLCELEKITTIVVGFPVQDPQSVMAARIHTFLSHLKKAIQLPVILQDETLSSKEALAKMIAAGKKKKARRQDDAAAAAIILQNYLDTLGMKL